jgi:CelD/BcsL family acetyltransferase involved in cellulose biosynthesis
MIVERATSFEALREEWGTLPVRSPFATWEWHETWWRHFGSRHELMLQAVRQDGDLVGVLPLYRSRLGPLRIVRFTGRPQADEQGPVGTAGAAELLDALAEIEHDVFLGEQLPGGEDWPGRLGGRRFRFESGPVIRQAGGWQPYLAAKSANFRQQLQRRERRLHERYQAVFRLVTDGRSLDRELDVLFALHRSRWGGASGFGPEDFHREFARLAFDAGRLRLWFLELDGAAAAAWYGFRVGDVESYYQAGRDTAYDDVAPGFVLLAHTVRQALDDGVAEYRLLRGDEPYKRRFADNDPGLETVIRTGSRGRGATAIATALAIKRARALLIRRRCD